jgi:hypothetical protein
MTTPQGWADRVAYTADGVAHRPEQVIYPSDAEDAVREMLDSTFRPLAAFSSAAARAPERSDTPLSALSIASGVPDPRPFVRALRDRGVSAQLNHVLFAHCGGGCEPHPATVAGVPGAPVAASPVYATPVYATPVYATPVYATPVYATPVYATPVYATGEERVTGRRRSSAQPVSEAEARLARRRLAGLSVDPRLRVVVLDSGLPGEPFAPNALQNTGNPGDEGVDVPDSDADGRVDPVAGHGVFIKGLIKQIAPSADIAVKRVLQPEGDGDERTIADEIDELGATPELGGILSLSFGAPVLDDDMVVLSRAITRAQARGWIVVASAGNDASCRPAYPAAFPDVVSVGAVGPNGPAPFTNYGPWVRACAPGVDLISTWFDNFDGDAAMGDLDGWGRWSGTSFSGPVVVGALAQQALDRGIDVKEAVERVIDGPANLRLHNLGTVVDFR